MLRILKIFIALLFLFNGNVHSQCWFNQLLEDAANTKNASFSNFLKAEDSFSAYEIVYNADKSTNEVELLEKVRDSYSKVRNADLTPKVNANFDRFTKFSFYEELGNNTLLLNKITGNAELLEVWYSLSKYPKLRSNVELLTSLSELSKKGIGNKKLNELLGSGMIDIMDKASATELETILGIFKEQHFTSEYVDGIVQRFVKYSEVKSELIANPSKFKAFDDVLTDPLKYKEAALLGEITTTSKLYQWTLGKYRKVIFENADNLQKYVSDNIDKFINIPKGYKKATQAHLRESEGFLRTVPDDFIYDPQIITDPISRVRYYRAIINDSKLHDAVDWTNNQWNLIIKRFKEENIEFIDFDLVSNIAGLDREIKVRIYRQDVYKSIGTPDKTGTYLSTKKVFE